MATDRFTSTRQLNRASACRECLEHAQYGSILRSGSERSERIPVPDWILCGLSIRRLRPEGIDPLWGVSCRRRLYNRLQKFMPKFLDLSTIVHKSKQSFISQNMLEHIVKYLWRNRTNMRSCIECFTNCGSISNTCS